MLCAILASASITALHSAHAGELDIQANDVSYDAKQQSYIAIGAVEISRNGKVLLANHVRYNQDSGMIYAEGDVQLRAIDGTILYADTMHIDDTLTREHATNFRAETPEKTRVAASTVIKEDDSARNFKHFVYTACKRCEEEPESPPVWQVNASEAKHDLQKREYVMKNAVVKVAGVPVFYTPYFSHPDSTVQRQSGLISPTLGSSSQLGQYLITPYFIDLDLDKSLLITPTVTNKSGAVMAVDYTQAVDTGTATAKASYGELDLGKGNGKQKVGHYEFSLALRPQPHSELGGTLRHTSNPGYLSQLPVRSSNFGFLYSSNAYWRQYGLQNPRNRIEATALSYNDHRSSVTVDQAPSLVPEVKGQFYSDTDTFGGRIHYNFAARHIQQKSIADSQNLSIGADYRIGQIMPYGIVADYQASVEGNYFHYSSDQATLDTGSKTQIYPRLHANWRLPFQREFEGSTGVFEPIVSFNLSPSTVNSSRLPNQDAGVLVSNETLLYSSEKISGRTRRDDSTRLSLAAEYNQYWQSGTLASLLIGRNFELSGTSLSKNDIALKRYESRDNDYIVRSRFSHHNGFNIENRITVDNNGNQAINSNEVETAWINMVQGFTPTLDYTYNRADSDYNLIGQHQFTAGFVQQIGDFWSFSGQTHYDLNNTHDKFRTGQLRLAYEDECLKIVSYYKRDLNVSRYTTQDKTLGLNFELKFGG